MPKIYEASIKKTIYGFCKIIAENEDEASEKARQIASSEEGEEQIEFFEDENSKEVIGVDNLENN